LSFSIFYFSRCIICPSIYGFYLPLSLLNNILKTLSFKFLKYKHAVLCPEWLNDRLDQCYRYTNLEIYNGLIVWCLTPLSTIFQLYRGGDKLYPVSNRRPILKYMVVFHFLKSTSNDVTDVYFK